MRRNSFDVCEIKFTFKEQRAEMRCFFPLILKKILLISFCCLILCEMWRDAARIAMCCGLPQREEYMIKQIKAALSSSEASLSLTHQLLTHVPWNKPFQLVRKFVIRQKGRRKPVFSFLILKGLFKNILFFTYKVFLWFFTALFFNVPQVAFILLTSNVFLCFL